MTKTTDDLRVGICLGHKLRKEAIKITNIVVYYRKSIHQPFNLEMDRAFTNSKACITFAFNKKNHEELFFATQTQIFAWNYMQENRRDRIIQRLTQPLDSSNIKFVNFNSRQNAAVIISDVDAAFVKFQTKKERAVQVDLDDQEGIRWIRNVCIDRDKCYLLANKHESRVGLYLLQLDMNEPETPARFLINWNNKLDIGDCRLAVMNNNNDPDGNPDTMVMSYKMIGYNTFNVVAIDLENNCLVRYWHESYALWESPVQGFLI